MPYGSAWRALRRVFSEKYSSRSPKALQAFYTSHRASVSSFLKNVLREPEAFSDHLKL